MVSQDLAVLRESQSPYGIKKEEPIDLSTLSHEFQESIKRGLTDVEAGRVYTQEQMKKFFEDWLQEN